MAKIEWSLKEFKIENLTDYYKNPRQLTEKQYKQLKTSLDKFGMIDKPIVNVDGKNTIIGGHQRLNVLRKDGAQTVTAWVPSRELDEREVEELNIRLNKNTGEWDFDTLVNDFEFDDLLDWGFEESELIGFDEDEPVELNEKGLEPYKKAHYLISYDLDLHAEVSEVVSQLYGMIGVEIDSTVT